MRPGELRLFCRGGPCDGRMLQLRGTWRPGEVVRIPLFPTEYASTGTPKPIEMALYRIECAPGNNLVLVPDRLP